MAIHLVLLQIILLLWPINATEALCQTRCGNVSSIRYPFGIGKGCYFDPWFEITCLYSSGSPKAYLSSLKLEILDVQHSSSNSIIVKVPITSFESKNTRTAKRLNLSGSPFLFSNNDNRFAAIGCNKYAMINSTQNDSTTGKCVTVCTCDPTQHNSRGCYDFFCSIPPNSKYDYENLPYLYSKIGTSQECSSIFTVDEKWLELNYPTNNPNVLRDQKDVAATLEFGKYMGNCWELYNSDTSCNGNDECLIQLYSGYFCLCDGRRSDIYRGCRGNLHCNSTTNNDCSKCPDGYNSDDHQGAPYCSTSRDYDYILIKKSRIKFIIIIASSSGLGMLLLVVGAWRLYKFIKRRKAMKLKQKFLKRNGGFQLQQHLSSNEGNIEKTKLFTSKELEKATDNYNANRILGQGGQGIVYKGMLSDGRIVAIKKSKIVDESKVEEFINEVIILSQISHRNVVQLLGCCLETEVPLLVYELIPNGTLFQYIHEENEDFPITWELRLRIAIEVAGALSYLHSAASIPIYHRDIKSTNILLDDKYRAKVSDFGTSRSISVDQTHLTTQVHGTFGYLDPEYFRSSQFTDKSDVYSFGVVLAELLTGQKPIRSTNLEEDRSLAAYFLCAIKEGRLFEILDSRVLKEGRKEEVMIFANLTRQCLNLNGRKRPTMRKVANELAGIRSNTVSIMQENCKEIDYVDGDIINQFETSSSVTGSLFDSVPFSIDADPLISRE